MGVERNISLVPFEDGSGAEVPAFDGRVDIPSEVTVSYRRVDTVLSELTKTAPLPDTSKRLTPLTVTVTCLGQVRVTSSFILLVLIGLPLLPIPSTSWHLRVTRVT